MRADPPLPAVFTRPDAVRAGLGRNQVTRRVGSGRWHALVRGAFCLADDWERACPEERHLLLARAVLLTRREPEPQALSHVTAAAVFGLPVPRPLLDDVWLTAPFGSGRSTRYRAPVRREVATLEPQDVVARRGMPVTRQARTVADCLRHLDLVESVPIADAALHAAAGQADGLRLEHIARVLDTQTSWPYASRGVRALPLLDGRRESVLESRSAITFGAFGLPAPIPQAVILDRNGNFVARVDFLWREYGVVGEADGAGKYRGDDPVRVIREEKDRQALLEALGLVVVRWDWRHLFGEPPEVVVRLRRAFGQGDPRRFRGLIG